MKRILALVIALSMILMTAGCSQATDLASSLLDKAQEAISTESPETVVTEKPEETEKPEATPVSEPTATPAPTETPEPTATPAPTETPAPTKTPAPTEEPQSVDSLIGMWNDRVYENAFFGFGLEIPEGDYTIRKMAELNGISEDNLNYDYVLKYLTGRATPYLLNAVDSNGTTIAVLAENLKAAGAESMTEEEYAQIVADGLKKQLLPMNYTCESEKTEPADFLGGTHVYYEGVFSISSVNVYTTYFFVRTGDHMLAFLVTSADPDLPGTFYHGCYVLNS